jgi:hypothetical protein
VLLYSYKDPERNLEDNMVNTVKYERELNRLRDEHKDLDIAISEQLRSKIVNSFVIQTLKKKKMEIKQAIARLESILLGDIVA